MKNEILVLMQKSKELVSNVQHRIDEFWKKEDQLYWLDPVAYCRRTDWFWARISMVICLVMMLSLFLFGG